MLLWRRLQILNISLPSLQHRLNTSHLDDASRASSILGRIRQNEKGLACSLNKENVEYVLSKQLGSIVVSRRLSRSVFESDKFPSACLNCLPLIITTQLWLIILSKSVGERTFRYRKSLHNFHIGDNLIKYLHLIIRSNAEISNAQQRCHKWD